MDEKDRTVSITLSANDMKRVKRWARAEQKYLKWLAGRRLLTNDECQLLGHPLAAQF